MADMRIEQAISSAKHSDYDGKEHLIIQALYKEINRLKRLIEQIAKDADYHR